eukprot:SAG31_NODE_1946_length_6844_cov_5.947665_1_plen_316_part_00
MVYSAGAPLLVKQRRSNVTPKAVGAAALGLVGMFAIAAHMRVPTSSVSKLELETATSTATNEKAFLSTWFGPDTGSDSAAAAAAPPNPLSANASVAPNETAGALDRLDLVAVSNLTETTVIAANPSAVGAPNASTAFAGSELNIGSNMSAVSELVANGTEVDNVLANITTPANATVPGLMLTAPIENATGPVANSTAAGPTADETAKGPVANGTDAVVVGNQTTVALSTAAKQADAVHTMYVNDDITKLRNQISDTTKQYQMTAAGEPKDALGAEIMNLKSQLGPLLDTARSSMKAEHDSHRTHLDQLPAVDAQF